MLADGEEDGQRLAEIIEADHVPNGFVRNSCMETEV